MKKILFFIAVAFLSGCASPAKQGAMSINFTDLPTNLNRKFEGELSVRNVTGGKETGTLKNSGKPQVDNDAFRGALEQSLRAVGYISPNSLNAKYQIDAQILNIEQPSFGLSFDVKSTVLYTINSLKDQKSLPITAIGIATFSDAVIGVERLRIATEKSIKENISQFIKKISEEY
jgi:hypothetical protein